VDRPISLTIGTAGHVDHGKTTLVQRMTGTDTDRLEEEHRRGISILPGYAELELPGGRRASLIDVPGHERFVKNMVSGSTGVDAFLVVVAADDGVMPQTREHLDVLRLLGVQEGVVALTKIDTVDEETADLARLEVEELLEEHDLSAPVHRVSGATGEGVDGLLEALDEISGSMPGHEAEAMACLPVDPLSCSKVWDWWLRVRCGQARSAPETPSTRPPATVCACAPSRTTGIRQRPPTRGHAPPSTSPAQTPRR